MAHLSSRAVQAVRNLFATRRRIAAAASPVIEAMERRDLFSVPNGPWGLGVTATAATTASLTWLDNPVNNEQGYRVDRSTAGGAFQTVGSLPPAATSFTDTTLAAGTQYTYHVYAYNASGVSSCTADQTIVTDGGTTAAAPIAPAPVAPVAPVPVVSAPVVSYGSVPNGPYVLTAVPSSSSRVDLLWYNNASNETGYRVERKAAGGAYAVIATLTVGSTTWSDATAAAGNTYVYRVCAYNAAGNSGYTNEGSATIAGTGLQGGTTTTTTTTTTTPITTTTPVTTTPITATPPATVSPAGYFPTAVFYQPTSSFDKWKSRGINTLYGYDGLGGATIAQWDAAAAARGFKEIRQASANPWADNSVSNLIAWLQPQDEPDMNGIAASTMMSQYTALKAVNPNRPVITTYSGGYVLGWQKGVSASAYAAYLNATDWAGSDVYPVTGWNLPNQLGSVGQTVDALQAINPSKRQFAFVETSNQVLSWVPNERGVTPDEMRAELWNAVIHGATGVVYFPQQIAGGTLSTGFNYDATPANVVAEMTAQNARLQDYGAALLSQENPAGVSVKTSGGLEATWRTFGGKTYVFVLNLSAGATSGAVSVSGVAANATASVGGENRAVNVSNGTIADAFKPYEVHVYVV